MRIYVKAYLDRNLGDDLMLVQLARETNGKCELFIHCEDHNYSFYSNLLNTYPHIRLINCPLRQFVIKYGWDFFSAVLQIGGSVLMGNTYKGCFYRLLNSILFFRLKIRGISYAIIGCNIGPFKNSFMEWFVKLEIKQARLITVRDRSSLRYVKKISPKLSHIYYYPDMLSNAIKPMEVGKGLSQIKKQSCVLGIAVHGPSSNALTKCLSAVCNEFIKSTEGTIILFCFDMGTQNDYDAALKISNKINKKFMSRVMIITHNADYSQMVRKMAECTRILAVRFHAAILAISLGIPFLAISYSNKMSNYLEDLSEKAYSIAEVHSMGTKEFTNQLINYPIEPRNEWRLKANGHIRQFLSMLKMPYCQSSR